MKKRLQIVVLLATLSAVGCYMPIEGRVIDAETKQPIEGAVILVEWTKKHGFGDAWTESYKVVEVISDKKGMVNIKGCYSPFVEPPDITVYKKGYVAWNDKAIFSGPSRTDFKWGDYVFKLENFKEVYSYDAHTTFIHLSINSSLEKNYELKKHMIQAFEWEEELALKERLRKRNNP